jgi:hypothetical protein
VKHLFLLIISMLLVNALTAADQKSSLKDLPLALQYKISQDQGRENPAFHIKKTEAGFTALQQGTGISGMVHANGMEIRFRDHSWALNLEGISAPGTDIPIRFADNLFSLTDNKVVFSIPGFTSWVVNGPLGLQQGWTIEKRPATGQGILSLCFREEGDLSAGYVPDKGSSLALSGKDGNVVLNYQGLYAYDSRGTILPAWFEKTGKQVFIRVDDQNAEYPVSIDPYTQVAKLTASDGADNDQLGLAVSISSDGSTVVAGTPSAASGGTHRGVVYVYTKQVGGWTSTSTFAAKLTVSDGANSDNLGNSVFVSSDGSTVVAGAPNVAAGGSARGAAYVYVKPGGGWATTSAFTAKLTASDGANNDQLGNSVSVSSDGSTVVAGAHAAAAGGSARGAAYVYVKPGGGWATTSTFTAKLTASDGANSDQLGTSVSVSSDGSTVVAGVPYASAGGNQRGQVYVYVKPGGGWTTTSTFTAKLTASDGANYDQLGNSVSVSSDGTTVAAGAIQNFFFSPLPGTVYLYVKPGGGWITTSAFTAKLTASDGANGDRLGNSVFVSPDGTTVVAGAPYAAAGGSGRGSAYVYVKPGGGWATTSTFTAKLTASDGANSDNLGYSVSVCSDGSTVVAGTPNTAAGGSLRGGTYVFISPVALIASASVISNVSCNGGSNGSVIVTVSGGTSPYTYAWSTSPVQNTQTASGLTAGTYWVTVTDAVSATATSSATVTQPSDLTTSIAHYHGPDCGGGNNGWITVSCSGGTPVYTYSWSNGQTGSTASSLTMGAYTVTVTDNHGCTATTGMNLTAKETLDLFPSSTPISCKDGTNGTATVLAVACDGPAATMQYLWSTGGTTATITGLSAGTYSVTVTHIDPPNDPIVKDTLVLVPEPLNYLLASSSHTDVACFGQNKGSATVNATGGTGNYTYSWSTLPAQTSQTATGLSAGTYWVTVTDANSCTATSSASLTQPPDLIPGISGPAIACQNSTGNIYTTETGMSNYQWVVSAGGTITSGGTTSANYATITWNTTGLKTVSVNYTTPAGCTAAAPAVKNVTVNPAPVPAISGPDNVTNHQSATYTTPAVPGHTYTWSVNSGYTGICSPNESNCIMITWILSCGDISAFVRVTETDGVTGCSTTVTKLITVSP